MAHERRDLVLYVAPDQRVIHLPGRKLSPSARFLNLKGGGGLPGRPVREAQVPDLAHSHKIVQGFDSLLQRRELVFLVNDVEVNVIRVEPLETLIARGEDVASRKAGLRDRLTGSEADLGGDYNGLSPRPERLAEHHLGLTASVHVGGVKEIDARLKRPLDHRSGVFLINLVNRRSRGIAAKCHRAERKP
jgi:hypothetical protein